MMKNMSFNTAVALNRVQLDDAFWTPYDQLVRDVVIPYQYEALLDRIPGVEPSYAVRNFRIAAGLEQGEFGGMVFQDSDVAKWLEAVGYLLSVSPDPELEKKADEIIDVIAQAQWEDGYLNTYYTIKEPGKRWTNLYDCHELYCAGHMIEAAVAYYKATGKRKLLNVVCRFADHIDSVFGPEPGKIQGYGGHQEIELALVKLYEVTQEERYLKLSQFFIDERGKQPHFFHKEWEQRGKTSFWNSDQSTPPDLEYNQSHLPVRQQTKAVGHAVRAVYMYTAMADLALLNDDPSLFEACKTIWNNIVNKQMYITGGIGSAAAKEAFTFDYDLPNDTAYAETCASIGLIFFARRMLQREVRNEYADVLERALYNNVLAGIAKDGKHYFYVNPLEVWPQACEKNPTKAHVEAERQGWFGCSCCPPNIARLIASLGEYIYSSNQDTLYAHLFIGGKANIEVGKQEVEILQQTDYPEGGNVKFILSPSEEQTFTFAWRVPGWCEHVTMRINGEETAVEPLVQNGYAMIERTWKPGDTVEIHFDMTIRIIRSHPQVRANAGKAAIQRGPIVYCLEEADNPGPISSISLSADPALRAEYDQQLLGGTTVILGNAWKDDEQSWGEHLYDSATIRKKETKIKAIPYYLWGNRGKGEMSVWIRTNDSN